MIGRSEGIVGTKMFKNGRAVSVRVQAFAYGKNFSPLSGFATVSPLTQVEAILQSGGGHWVTLG